MSFPGQLGAILRKDLPAAVRTTRFTPILEHYFTGAPLAGPFGRPLTQPGASGPGFAYIPPSATVSRTGSIGASSWDMLMNDTIGCCTISGICHVFMALRALVQTLDPTTVIPRFGSKAVVTAYSAVSGYVPGDPSTDNGADLQTVLDYCRTTGIPDTTGYVHKVASYAAFGNPADLELNTQVLNAYGTVYQAATLQQAQEDQFSNGEPWDYVNGSLDVGGHCFDLQLRGTDYTGVYESVTWGQLQRTTRGFVRGNVGSGRGEAWAVFSQDFLDAAGSSISGLNQGQLQADLQYV